MITYGSLFSGIGGFDLGFDRAGMQCRWQVEKDDRAREVLESHWLDVKRYEDVCNVGARNLESVDVICGGFPCQDLSVAGKREGLAGERSGLWYEFHRIIRELKPGWVVIENVPGLLSSNGGRDFAVILRGLAECGYLSAWRVLDAQYFGLAQRRKRVFIVASLGTGRAAQVLFESEGGCWNPPPGREERPELATDVATSLKGGSGERGFPIEWEAGLATVARSVRPRSGMPQGWNSNLLAFDTTQITSKENGSNPKPGDPCHPLSSTAHPPAICNAFNGYTGGADDNDAQGWHYVPALSEMLNSGGNDGGFRTEPGAHVVAPGISPTLQKESYSPMKSSTGQQLDWCITDLRHGVRRLTPTECERLQGFPDGHTANQSDSARYRQLGNAVAVPVAEWIGRRIAALT